MLFNSTVGTEEIKQVAQATLGLQMTGCVIVSGQCLPITGAGVFGTDGVSVPGKILSHSKPNTSYDSFHVKQSLSNS